MSVEPSEWPEGGPWTLPIAGFAVNHITFGGLVIIVAYGDGGGRSETGEIVAAPSATLKFESGFDMVKSDGSAVHLDPSRQEWEDLAPLFGLRHDHIASAIVTDDTQLEISFSSGTKLLGRSDPNYESWAITGPGFQLISMPGGGVAVFRE